MQPMEQQRHLQAIGEHFVAIAPQGWARLVGNWEAVPPDGEGQPTLNYLTLAVVDLGDRWGFGQIAYDEPLYDLVADYWTATRASDAEVWTVLDLEVDTDGGFRSHFSFDSPKRSNGIHDEESIGRFENYLQTWIDEHGPVPRSAR